VIIKRCEENFQMVHGAIILCGGNSSRMGRDKATLPFGREQMLERVVRLVSEVIEPDKIVVVTAADRALPPLIEGVMVAHDLAPQRGPLEGLAAGMRGLAQRADAAYATACDVPFLVPGFIERMFELLGEYEIVVPRDGQHHHPLAAVYRTSVLPHIERLLAADRLRPRFLFDEVATREVNVEQLRDVDPQLTTLQNLNYPHDYEAALAAAGLV
jgi:molybdopterin-guanine dinucleotide biosynthesis protein A